jgi:histidyl-tRNA synthetase
VGIPRGDYVIRVNNRKVLNGVMEVAGLLDPPIPKPSPMNAASSCAPSTSSTRLGEDGRAPAAGQGRARTRAAITSRGGVGLSDGAGRPILGFPPGRADGAGDAPNLARLVGGSEIGREGVAELEQIADLLAAQGYGPDRIVIDPSVVRGLGYYTGPVYEAELTFEITDEKGRPRQFGSVAGGGRYDDLVKRFTGQEVPATGVSIGVDRLLAALRAKGRIGGTRGARRRHRDGSRPDGRLPGDGGRAAQRGHPGGGLSRQPEELRQPAEIRRQTRKARWPSSRARTRPRAAVQLKDLILGAKLAEDATLEEWKSQPAQTEVPRDDLVPRASGASGPAQVTPNPTSAPRPRQRFRRCSRAAGAVPVDAAAACSARTRCWTSTARISAPAPTPRDDPTGAR